jgi:fibronectin type 3 domain-containing protein
MPVSVWAVPAGSVIPRIGSDVRSTIVAALLVLAMLPVRANAASSLSVFAAPGPAGMTVRWVPAHAKEPLTATVVRIASDGSRATLAQVSRPNDAASQAFNAAVDRHRQGVIALVGTIQTALMRGDAVIDPGVRAGLRYRYQVTLSDGESGTSNLSPPAGAKPRLDKMTIVRLTAVGEDRRIRLIVTPQVHGGLLQISRSTGGLFEAVATVACQGRGDTIYQERVTAGQPYTYRVAWIDIFGNVGPESQPVSATAKDLHQAMPVLGLRTSAEGSLVTLSWQASSDRTVASYDVYRGATNSRLARIASVEVPRTVYQDRAMPGSILRYDVRARTRAGVEGMPSSGVSLLVPKKTPPDAPKNLAARPQRDGVELSWSPSRDPTVNRYNIYRRAAAGTGTLLAQVTASQHSFAVKLPENTIAAYAYGIGATDRFGNRTMPAEWVTARALRTSIPVASAPLRVRAKGVGVWLTLAPLVDPDVIALELYRRADGGAVERLVKVSPDTTSYEDRSVRAGHKYAYSVAAVLRAGGEGKRSAESSVRLAAVPVRSPAVSAKLLGDGLTVELHWAQASGIVGYMIVRRAPDGSMATIAPLVRAFTYRDVLAPDARGTFSYAVRVVTQSGPAAMGPFTRVTVSR